MKNFAKVSIILSLIFSIIACGVFSPQTNEPSEITLTDEKPIVVLDTGNSDYPRIALFKEGETIVPDLDVNQNGEIVGIHGATFIASNGESIYYYFENDLPVRAIVDNHLIQFENFTGNTVDITFISPDGTVTKKDGVPFDSSQIRPIGNQSSIHLASMVKTPNYKDINWLSFVLDAVTIFSCVAAATAVIVPTAGAATVILGASCATLAYATYLTIANKEPPILVEEADIVISGAGCALGVAKKDPIAVKDCADAVIDIVDVAKKETQETEQKLVTMVGADPNTRLKLFTEAQIDPNSQSTSTCIDLNLTSAECANMGNHWYSISSNNAEIAINTTSSLLECIPIEYLPNFTFTFFGQQMKACESCDFDFTKVGENTYERISTGVSGDEQTDIYYFSESGFTIEFTSIDTYYNHSSGCKYTTTFTLTK